MTRLDQELQRLYLPLPPAAAASPATPLPAADGRLRALVLDLQGADSWARLAPLWQAVQAALELPAPAIAVNGLDGMQLWFSLAAPVPAAEGAAFLDALCQRHLADVPARRLRLLPGTPDWHPGPVPAAMPGVAEQWSAFVSQDLAPMFAETPWLDMPPNPDGQAGLLAPLRSATPAAWQQALQQLGLAPAEPWPVELPPAAAPATVDARDAVDAAVAPGRAAPPAGPQLLSTDPRQFLQAVMADPGVPLALRIEAAKALLQASPPR